MVWISESFSFQGVEIERSHCIEVSSHQEVGIEEFYCIQRYPYFRELEYYIQRCPHFRGLE